MTLCYSTMMSQVRKQLTISDASTNFIHEDSDVKIVDEARRY